MTKKDFVWMPLVFGIGVMVLAVITAAAFALDECNKHKRSDKKKLSDVCQSDVGGIPGCSTYGNKDCTSEQSIRKNLPQFDDERFFSRTETGVKSDHAIELTYVCGIVVDCKLDNKGNCVSGEDAISPTTGNSIKRIRPYYDNDDCVPGE